MFWKGERQRRTQRRETVRASCMGDHIISRRQRVVSTFQGLACTIFFACTNAALDTSSFTKKEHKKMLRLRCPPLRRLLGGTLSITRRRGVCSCHFVEWLKSLGRRLFLSQALPAANNGPFSAGALRDNNEAWTSCTVELRARWAESKPWPQ